MYIYIFITYIVELIEIYKLFKTFTLSVVLVLQVGHIYAWSIVYNILRIYTPKTKVVTFDESTKFEEINNPKNLSKCSIRALTPIKEESLSNGHIDQLQVECKVIDGQEKVGLFSNIYFTLFFSIWLLIYKLLYVKGSCIVERVNRSLPFII